MGIDTRRDTTTSDLHSSTPRTHAPAAPLTNAVSRSVQNANEQAMERARAASLPPWSAERRMFHELVGIDSVLEDPVAKGQRIAQTFGYGAPLSCSHAELCCICLDSLVRNEVALALPCGHMFHEACIHQWLGRKPCCPLCKAVVPS